MGRRNPCERNLCEKVGSGSPSTKDGRNAPTSLVLGQFPSLVVHESLRIYEPYAFTGLLLRETLEFKETHELLSNANTSRSSSEEEDLLFGERQTGSIRRELCRVDETREDNGASALLSGQKRRYK